MKYSTRNDVVNMYKEYRNNSLCGAVSQLYNEIAGRHSGRGDSIHIIKTSVVPDGQVRRPGTLQYANRNVRFPKITQIKRAPIAQQRSVFKASRPVKV